MIRLAGPMALLCLAACGDTGGGFLAQLPLKDMVQAQVTGDGGGAAPTAPPPELDAETLAEGRRALEAAGQPVMAVSDAALGLATFMVPLGQNGDVTTWANPEYQTIGLRDGVLLATRGFGTTDLMSAEAPGVAVLRQGAGQYSRKYYLLDGADQTLILSFDCGLNVAGAETVAILGRSYATRKIVESCAGDTLDMENIYWFDAQGLLRQSRQTRGTGVDNLLLQAIID